MLVLDSDLTQCIFRTRSAIMHLTLVVLARAAIMIYIPQGLCTANSCAHALQKAHAPMHPCASESSCAHAPTQDARIRALPHPCCPTGITALALLAPICVPLSAIWLASISEICGTTHSVPHRHQQNICLSLWRRWLKARSQKVTALHQIDSID